MSGSPARPRPRPARRLLGERGAAAVEFALVIPVLLLLLLGIMEVSAAFNTQATLSAAAREGARSMVTSGTVASARSAVQTAAGPLAVSSVSISPVTCVGAAAGTTVTVTVTARRTFVAGVLGSTGVDLTGTAAMRCG
ncbi:pilus assembly protein [Modestobacter sp. VKM Ac-2979]|uniref:TadE family protein n=1 Tax=unclassified Modestobacter TaxID=2643866 RepID=UPI0022ABA157|nr:MULTISPECIES: TadE/TadG family type IV pilus assembly protein [unclassified Modestobacter]MCZ2810084.1 pilus assembly protein [Modestobacter sp. VKM Ac-2979]MCZ2844715.1 pilus assembly protein [Modestobacter sp. VKM Ac-2980]